MSNISQEYWEDVIPDPNEDPEGYIRFYDNLHEFTPSKERNKWGNYKCVATLYRTDGSERICNGSSHDSNHLPIDGCCYCKHGVYIHTSYDIPCGRCEMGDYEEDTEDYDLALEQLVDSSLNATEIWKIQERLDRYVGY